MKKEGDLSGRLFSLAMAILVITGIACSESTKSTVQDNLVPQAATPFATRIVTVTPETSVSKGPAIVLITTKTTYISGPDSEIDLPCNQAMKNLNLIDPEKNPNLTFEYPLVAIQTQDDLNRPLCIVLFKAKDKNSGSEEMQYYATLSSNNKSIVTEPINENPVYDKSIQNDNNTIQGIEIRSRNRSPFLLMLKFDGYQPTSNSYLTDRAARKLKYVPTMVIDAYGQNLLQPPPAQPVPLPAKLPAGVYRLLVGLYRWDTLERLPVMNDTSGENAVELERMTLQK